VQAWQPAYVRPYHHSADRHPQQIKNKPRDQKSTAPQRRAPLSSCRTLDKRRVTRNRGTPPDGNRPTEQATRVHLRFRKYRTATPEHRSPLRQFERKPNRDITTRGTVSVRTDLEKIDDDRAQLSNNPIRDRRTQPSCPDRISFNESGINTCASRECVRIVSSRDKPRDQRSHSLTPGKILRENQRQLLTLAAELPCLHRRRIANPDAP